MRLDVFTLIPGAFEWLKERRPVAAVLGNELELNVFNYRDTTPLSAGQVDDEPYGGGPGMVLRVDVVAAAFDAVYGGLPEHRVVALTPAGRPLDQDSRGGARPRARTDASLSALRRLRPAHPRSSLHRLGLDRPVRSLGRRDSRSRSSRCGGAPASRRAH